MGLGLGSGSCYAAAAAGGAAMTRREGCAFLTYYSRDSAISAQNALHEKRTLPGFSIVLKLRGLYLVGVPLRFCLFVDRLDQSTHNLDTPESAITRSNQSRLHKHGSQDDHLHNIC
ncbi:hypothetical protein M0802_006601 [Mischocyttarus mexicanus]|nr:hypothetical protein M0802_006601 [Mischocyttarus mexicanus]